MAAISVSIERNAHYSILIEENLLDQLGEQLRSLIDSEYVFVITETNVERLYGDRTLASLREAGISARTIVVPEGETSKSPSIANDLYDKLLAMGAARRDVIVAMGGGVITDLGGFVSATYMRGVPLVNLPTSLVAQLDASIGGKVAVNHYTGKNLIGAFYHPVAVYIDPAMVSTLPVEEIRNGLAEAIKVAIIGSKPLFEYIETHYQELLERNIPAMSSLITEAVKAKLELLTPDPFEHNLRRALNFGHTVGHVLETLTEYGSLSHGQAISIGMATAARLALCKGLCDGQTSERIMALLQQVGLPISAPRIDLDGARRGLRVIEAVRGRALNFVVPTGIGSCSILDTLPLDHTVECLEGPNDC